MMRQNGYYLLLLPCVAGIESKGQQWDALNLKKLTLSSVYLIYPMDFHKGRKQIYS